jgi:asparagine synthetase B (glutamine-hydrolysing)
MFAVDAETQLPDDLLLLTDKMSMAVSLECRVPLLDHQLVELAAAMPAVDQGARWPAQAPDEGVAGRSAARRHPQPQEARLRHADGRLAEARTGAPAAATAGGRGGELARPVSSVAGDG